MQAFLIALQFLTIFPTPQSGNRFFAVPEFNEAGLERSVIYFGLIGLLVGGLLFLISTLCLSIFSSPISALITLIAWVLFTGALHLDGLADSSDALIGGMGNPQKTLAILKDPNAGPIAVCVISLTLLLKFVCIEVLIRSGQAHGLIFIACISRLSVLLLFRYSPYISQEGLGSFIKVKKYQKHIYLQLSLVSLIFSVLIGFKFLVALALSALIFFSIRKVAIKRLGGINGDIAGAFIEIQESLLLLSVCIAL